MHLLIVTPYFAPDLGPSSPLVTMLAEDLAAMGHKVTVLAAVPHFPSGQVHSEFRGHIWQWQVSKGLRVCRVWVPSGNRANLRHRLVTFLVYQVLATLAGLRLAYDTVLVTNPAIETGLPFCLLAWMRRKPTLFCVWDLYPEVGEQLGIFRNPVVIRLVKAMEDFCLRRANLVQVLSSDFIPNLRHRVDLSRLVLVPPWLDTEFIRPLPRVNAFSREHDLDNAFAVLYAGNLGLSQGLANVLLAAERLAPFPDIQFVFVGDGAGRTELISRATKLKLVNVRFIPLQPRERLPQVLASADLGLVSMQKGIGASSLPSKVFPILASARPIVAIADNGSGLLKLVQEYGAGICIPPDDPNALVEAILELYRCPQLAKQMGQRGRSCAVAHHSRVAVARQFAQLIAPVPVEETDGH